MPVIAKEPEKEYYNVTEGRHDAVLAGIKDLGYVTSTYGTETRTKPKVLLIFETDEAHPKFDGPATIAARYTLSTHLKSNLRPVIESLLGRKMTASEARGGFDLETLIGVPCEIMVTHTQYEGRTFANIDAVIPLKKGQKGLVISDNWKERHKEPSNEVEETVDAGPPQSLIPDDELPF